MPRHRRCSAPPQSWPQRQLAIRIHYTNELLASMCCNIACMACVVVIVVVGCYKRINSNNNNSSQQQNTANNIANNKSSTSTCQCACMYVYIYVCVCTCRRQAFKGVKESSMSDYSKCLARRYMQPKVKSALLHYLFSFCLFLLLLLLLTAFADKSP